MLTQLTAMGPMEEVTPTCMLPMTPVPGSLKWSRAREKSLTKPMSSLGLLVSGGLE